MIASPGSTVTVAVRPVSVPSEHVMSVSDQPAVADSVIVFAPKPSPEIVNTRVFDSVPSPSSSSEKPDSCEPVVVNAKSCASLGCASLTIVKVASFLFV